MKYYRDYCNILESLLQRQQQGFAIPQTTLEFRIQLEGLFKILHTDLFNENPLLNFNELSANNNYEKFSEMITSLQVSIRKGNLCKKTAEKVVNIPIALQSFIHLIAYESIITLADSALHTPLMTFITSEGLLPFDDDSNYHDWNNRIPSWLKCINSMANLRFFSEQFQVSRGDGEYKDIPKKSKIFLLMIHLFRQALQTWNDQKNLIKEKLDQTDGRWKALCAPRGKVCCDNDDPFTFFLFLCEKNVYHLLSMSNSQVPNQSHFPFITLKADIFKTALTADFSTLMDTLDPDLSQSSTRNLDFNPTQTAGSKRPRSESPIENTRKPRYSHETDDLKDVDVFTAGSIFDELSDNCEDTTISNGMNPDKNRVSISNVSNGMKPDQGALHELSISSISNVSYGMNSDHTDQVALDNISLDLTNLSLAKSAKDDSMNDNDIALIQDLDEDEDDNSANDDSINEEDTAFMQELGYDEDDNHALAEGDYPRTGSGE
jgi:hypothetical protein